MIFDRAAGQCSESVTNCFQKRLTKIDFPVPQMLVVKIALAAGSLLGAAAFTASPAGLSLAHRSLPDLAICAPRSKLVRLRASSTDNQAEVDGAEGNYDPEKQFLGDVNGYANPMATGKYVEDGWVDDGASSSSVSPGFFGSLFGGGGSRKSADARSVLEQGLVLTGLFLCHSCAILGT